MAYTGSHSYPYSMGAPSGPTGSPQRFHNPQGVVRPPRPSVGPNLGQQQQQQQQQQPPQASHGTQNIKFELLQYMTTEQLQSLLESDNRLKEMVEDLEEIKQKRLDKEMALAENRSLADFNLSREPRLREGRAQLARLHQEARSVRDVYDKDRRQLDEIQGRVSSTEVKVMLETAAEKAEEESEEIADKFLQGEFALDIFLEQFQDRRRIAHIRRIKADKMEELQHNGHISSPTSSDASGGALPYPAPSSSGGALPYPAPQSNAGASPYSSPARPAPQPPTYQYGSTAMGYSAPAPAQNQPWRPYGQQPSAMPTLGSYPH